MTIQNKTGAGQLDPTFGIEGVKRISVPGYPNFSIDCVGIGPDQQIYVGVSAISMSARRSSSVVSIQTAHSIPVLAMTVSQKERMATSRCYGSTQSRSGLPAKYWCFARLPVLQHRTQPPFRVSIPRACPIGHSLIRATPYSILSSRPLQQQPPRPRRRRALPLPVPAPDQACKCYRTERSWRTSIIFLTGERYKA